MDTMESDTPETDLNESIENSVEEETQEETNEKETGSPSKPAHKTRFVRLPLARVKQMMKMDPDCGIIAQDAVFLVTKATEMFIEYLARETGKQLGSSKRKTVMKRDVDVVIESIPHLCFLDGALE